MISVEQALAALFDLVEPLGVETVDLRVANGRVLAKDAVAARAQPPFAASSMDGYALRLAELEPDAMFKVIGESAAGRGYLGQVGPGQTVRIFTGAPVPDGADVVVIQEQVTRRGNLITLNHGVDRKSNIRPMGADFKPSDRLQAPRRLGPTDLALMAAMNVDQCQVYQAPEIAILATGDELVMPGGTPGPDQIIASNGFGLAAMLENLGAKTRLLPIAQDTAPSLRAAIDLAQGADLLVTIGGASVGDHDLVAQVAADMGLAQSFYKVAMRPGKPLMAGRLGAMPMIGLPGNPVSAMVCGWVFLAPMVRAMQGLGFAAAPRRQARLDRPLPANGPRAHYMRAKRTETGIAGFDNQDSALLTVLAQANALLIRPPHDPARDIGDTVEYIPLSNAP